MARKRRAWKTFQFQKKQDAEHLEAAVPNAGDLGRYQFRRDAWIVETNIPLRILRAMARMVAVALPDYVSDTTASWDKPDHD